MIDSNILINGEPLSQIEASDRGLQYGDGVFETIAVFEGQPLLWPEHRARLIEGCLRLKIPPPPTGALDAEVAALAQRGGRAVIKVIVTRGRGGRGYAPPADVVPTRLVQYYPWPEYPETWWEQGVRVRLCEMRLGRNPALAGIKHLNRLEHVMARAEWKDPDIAEGLMCDADENVIEGTMSNLFCAQGGVLRTPRLSGCGVAGIMRAQLLRLAHRGGLTVEETQLPLNALVEAEEVFLCNSVIGLWPVREIDGRQLALGPITAELMARLEASLGAWWYTKGTSPSGAGRT